MYRFSRIKNIPLDEQPRNKLIKHGAEHLSNAELLAIVLRTGNQQMNVLELSRKILSEFNLRKLSTISYQQVKKFPGIKKAKACQIIACFELARRFSSYHSYKEPVKSPKDVMNVVMQSLKFEKKEHFMGLYLDTRHFLIRKEVISIGTLDASLLHPREVFSPALTDGAKAIILVHNHPSGNPEPSEEDIQITKRLVEAGKTLCIEVLDHIIIGENCYFSFSEKGLL
jgi:DNA repair protein RadC